MQHLRPQVSSAQLKTNCTDEALNVWSMICLKRPLRYFFMFSVRETQSEILNFQSNTSNKLSRRFVQCQDLYKVGVRVCVQSNAPLQIGQIIITFQWFCVWNNLSIKSNWTSMWELVLCLLQFNRNLILCQTFTFWLMAVASIVWDL